MDRVNLIEVFSSVQGEGTLIGEYQVFIRFAGCNLKCNFCDTREALFIPSNCKIFSPLGLMKAKNPLNIFQLVNIVKEFNLYSASLTGGEPLLQEAAVANISAQLHLLGVKVFLNTNGTLPEALAEVIDKIDIVGVDVKLPRCSGISFDREITHKFLEIANKKEVFVKVVLTDKVQDSEFKEVISIVSGINRHIPLVIQPVGPNYGEKKGEINPPSVKQLYELYKIANEDLQIVRIIPQLHHLMGWK